MMAPPTVPGASVDQYAAQFPWIRVVHRPNRGFRKSGGGVVEAFYEGYDTLQHSEWEFIVKLDGDLTFSEDYFEKCFEHFDQEPRLGIGGGEIYHDLGGEVKTRSESQVSCPRGNEDLPKGLLGSNRRVMAELPGGTRSMKLRRICWAGKPGPSRIFIFFIIGHRISRWAVARPGEARCGVLRLRIPSPFVAASCLHRLIKKPYIVGSAAICYGFLKGYFTRAPRVNDTQLIGYVRAQQLRRLCGLETIWR